MKFRVDGDVVAGEFKIRVPRGSAKLQRIVDKWDRVARTLPEYKAPATQKLVQHVAQWSKSHTSSSHVLRGVR